MKFALPSLVLGGALPSLALRGALPSLALGAALALGAHAPVAAALWPGATVFPSARLLDLALAHAGLAFAGAGAGAIAGVGLGLLVTRAGGMALRGSVDALVAAAQAVPPVVVVALAFPVLGFGFAPTALALLLYAVMPVLRATVAAMAAVPAEAREAAIAMGMTPGGVLREVEWPLAWPLILPALRVALMLSVATAAVGALAGAATLGTPIVLGLQNQAPLLVLQGAAATAALAFLADGALTLVVGRSGAGADGPV